MPARASKQHESKQFHNTGDEPEKTLAFPTQRTDTISVIVGKNKMCGQNGMGPA